MTWSLYKKTEDDSDSKEPNLFTYSGEKLEPLKFSNGKTQEDVVKEVLDSIEKGNKIIFIKGVCGTGKSAIALNLAKNFKKSSIVVPIKSLQHQYEKDYTEKNFILKEDKSQLKISVIKGRNNFNCVFAGGKADQKDLPCDIELREKNMDRLLKYIELNPNVDKTDFTTLSDVRRMSVAPACPYWSPLLPTDANPRALENANKKKYMSVSGKEFALFQMKKGCGYYDQYEAYANSEVLIFNSQKYLIELAIGRKPRTDIDIIDECDEFLDNFANERKINLDRLSSALNSIFPDSSEKRDTLKDMIFLIDKISKEHEGDVTKIRDSSIIPLVEKIIENPYLAEDEENSYYNTVLEITKSFENLLDETYVAFESVESDNDKLFGKNEDTVYASLVSINLAQKFKDIIDMNNVLVLMSGTLHSEEVLRDIFGLENFKVIDAETKMPGMISKIRTGKEKNCKYANFSNGSVTREEYLKALSNVVENAKPPTLIHISSFGDLPTSGEKARLELNNLLSKSEVINEQMNSDPVKEFSNGKKEVLFSTKCARGVDFPGEKCNSIILTKYPYPNIQGLFWKILKQEQPDKFMEFYLDKANRELTQKVARGVRFQGDYVMLLSPDSRVLDARL